MTDPTYEPKLGDKVVDVATGFRGTLTRRTEYLGGEIEWLIEALYDSSFASIAVPQGRLQAQPETSNFGNYQ